MGIHNSPGIFQEQMNESFNEQDYYRAYIDDLLIISNVYFEDHIKKLDRV